MVTFANARIESPQTTSIQYDGVFYADLSHAGALWHMGSLDPQWRSLLPTLGANPEQADFARVEHHGVFVARAGTSEPLALMCQGMGALWPGVGRELYDEFPKAREAMDRIQSIASWDVLSLLDEADPEKINATRWQIPYLFLLEYAQWAYLSSLGLRPKMFCGHSLGELIALCCSGIYSPEVAWHILDTRAEHVHALEAKAEKNFGMMAIHAGKDVVDKVLSRWTEVRVANYNTPSQYIVGGPKDVLMEIRSFLRKQRIPAVAISVSLLFHHPQMRILREHSLLRLNMLSMHAPSTPVLSVSKILPYPNDQEDICRFIVDLDENPVRFSDCLTSMWETSAIRTFLEIGPQDVLSGLIAENLPKARVLSCGRKGKEALALRELCAKLYAAGYLERACLSHERAVFGASFGASFGSSKVVKAHAAPSLLDTAHASVEEKKKAKPLLDLLTRITGVSPIELSYDLRADLALRSSTYPTLLREAERIFEHVPSFEQLLRVVTVGDLFRVFSGERLASGEKTVVPRLESLEPLVRARLVQGRMVQTAYTREWCPEDHISARSLGLIVQGCSDAILRLCLPDLLLAVPGLLESPAVCVLAEDLYARTADFLHDTLGCRLTCKAGDAEACDVLVYLCCAEASSNLSTLPSRSIVGKRPVLLVRLWPTSPSKERLFAEASACAHLLSLGVSIIEYIPGQLRRRFHELATLFALDLSALISRRGGSHICWCDASFVKPTENVPSLPPLLAPPPIPPLATALVPERLGDGHADVRSFSAKVFFSRCHDRTLANLPKLPFCRALECVLYGAMSLSPWLRILGLSDFEFSPMPRLFDGVVREGRVVATQVNWVSLCGVQTRQVQARLTVEELLPSGRKARTSAQCLWGAVIMGDTPLAELPCPWMPSGMQAGMPSGMPTAYESRMSACRLDSMLHAFYTKENVPHEWQLLSFALRLDDDTAIFDLSWAKLALVAQAHEKEYLFFLLFFEACVQAATFLLSSEDVALATESGAPWGVASVGFVLFSSLPRTASCSMYLHRSQHAARQQRFDVKIVDEHGHTLVTLSQLQFERVAASPIGV